ncbi:MAG TPA: polyprenyl synthetase family protein, partial [Polyangiales bacterium]|nr:polyprenyl synthetase family protein [Polyangiales bacterium]
MSTQGNGVQTASANLWTDRVIARVNARLSEFFATKRVESQALSPRAPELVDAVAALTMRGGKRLRSLAVYAGFVAVNRDAIDLDAGVELSIEVAAAIELLQSYFLIQDDWMDDDEERRGGPSVHAALTAAHANPKLGASLAILAGDMAVGFAFELLHRAKFPPSHAAAARLAFDAMHFEVICGQQLDLLEHDDVTLTHHLKTGSYTVRGPLKLGALLGGASEDQLLAIERFGRPLGIAFQLRDDLLGTFGDSRATGKPAGHDLREGKNTALVAQARALMEGEARAQLERVL